MGTKICVLPSLTVIVPLAPQERAWTRLAADLAALPAGSEVLFAGPCAPRGDAGALLSGTRFRIGWVRTALGRGRQMNAAARAARGRFLWFLHADTRFGPGVLEALAVGLARDP